MAARARSAVGHRRAGGLQRQGLRLASLILPQSCVVCGTDAPLLQASPLCRLCFDLLPPAVMPDRHGCNRCGIELISEWKTCLACRERTYAFTSNVSMYAYRDATRELIRAYKFHGRSSLAGVFAERLAGHLEQHAPDAIVIPVPGRPAGVQRRGFDHMHLISAVLARRFGIPTASVLRRRGGAAQKGLDFAHRAQNLRGRVSLRRGASVPRDKAVLIDDVFTTGATADECARVLRAAGTDEVAVVTLARD